MSPNISASLFLVAYLIAVLVSKNEKAFVNQLLSEGDFLKWLSALSLVMAVSDELGTGGKYLTTMVYLAMALQAVKKNPNVFNDLSKILIFRGK